MKLYNVIYNFFNWLACKTFPDEYYEINKRFECNCKKHKKPCSFTMIR